MKKMDLQECSMQTNSATAVGRKYVKALLPILRRIHGLQQPSASRPLAGLTASQKAKLVRVAADLCLVKAAGGNAKWGKALYCRTLSSQKALRSAVQKCAIQDVEGDDDVRCLAADQLLGSDTGAKRTFFLAKEKIRRCRRYPHRSIQKRCRSIDIFDGYFIAGLIWDRYRGAHCCKGISTLSSQCTRIRQPEHEYSCSRRTCQTLRSLRIKSWFKKCCKTCTRPAHLHIMNKKAKAYKNRWIRAVPTISQAATISESNNEGCNFEKVHDMAGQIGALRKLIPGGDSLIMDSASLFEETALYILALQMQVHSLSALATNMSAPTHTQHTIP